MEQKNDQDTTWEETPKIYAKVICSLTPEVLKAIKDCDSNIKILIEDITGTKFYQETSICGTWSDVQQARNLLDEMVSVSCNIDLRSPGDVPSSQIGNCQHDPCRWRSEVFPVNKGIIQFMILCLDEEMESLLDNHTLFVASDKDMVSASVQCCGQDLKEAERFLERFKDYYNSIENRLWIGEFPRCTMLNDRFCQFLLKQIRCVLLNVADYKTIVVCHRNVKDKVTNILHKICATVHDGSVLHSSDNTTDANKSTTSSKTISEDIEKASVIRVSSAGKATVKIPCAKPSLASNKTDPSEYRQITPLASEHSRIVTHQHITPVEVADSISANEFSHGFFINNNLQVFIHRCDITKLHVDAISYISRKIALQAEGLPKAIYDETGPQLQKEIRHLLYSSDRIPVGGIVVSSSGNLPCERVIHAVGPSWTSVNDQATKKQYLESLHSTFKNLILAADKYGFSSLAVPAIISGVTRYVTETEQMRIIYDVLTSTYIQILEEIHIVDVSEHIISTVAGAFVEFSKKKPTDKIRNMIELDQDIVYSIIQIRLRKMPKELKIYNRVKILIYFDDITKLNADAIVCPNDDRLSCYKGLAKRIADIVGSEYKQLCKNAITHKKLEPSDVVAIHTDCLGIIINAIVPLLTIFFGTVNKYSPDAYKNILLSAVKRSIEETRKHDISTLAIYPLGIGQEHVPNLWIAEVISEALMESLKRDEQLKEIHIVDTNTDFLSIMWCRLYRQITDITDTSRTKGPRPVTSHAMAQTSQYKESNILTESFPVSYTLRDQTSRLKERDISKDIHSIKHSVPDKTSRLRKADISKVSSTKLPSRPQPEVALLERSVSSADIAERKQVYFRAAESVPFSGSDVHHGFLIGSNVQVFIHKCSITELEVDAIVNAASSLLCHRKGIAKEIANAAGPELEKEGREIIRRSGAIPVAGTVVTSAGRLPCKKVIHVVGPSWPVAATGVKEEHCLKLLRDTITNIVHTADKFDFRTLAMPAIICGGVASSKEAVARITSETLVDLSRHSLLEEIHLVCTATNSLSMFAGAFLAVNKRKSELPLVTELPKVKTSARLQMRITKQFKDLVVLDRVKVLLSWDDITKIKADAIVCSNDKRLSCSTGLAKKIADLVGKEYKQTCARAAKEKKLYPSDVVSIKTRDHGLIINVVVHDLSSSFRTYVKYNDIAYTELKYKSYRNVLTEAKKHCVTRLAMKPVCAEQKLFPHFWPARIMCEALMAGINSAEELKEIHIVDKNREFLMALWDELKKQVVQSTSSDNKIQLKLTQISVPSPKATCKEVTVTKAATLSSNQTRPETRPQITFSERRPFAQVTRRRTERSKHLSEELVSISAYKVPCGFLLSNRIKVFIHRCDITKIQVDAIVNAANRTLQHDAGVAKAIADAAGPDLEEEGREIINNSGPIPVSQTVVTSAGNLPCAKVIHAVRPEDWAHSDDEERQKHCLELLRDTFRNILQTADKCGIRSLAIPAVFSSTGMSSKDDAAIIYEMVASVFGLPKYKVASITCEVLINTYTDHLKEVHVVDTKCNILQLISGAFYKMSQLKEGKKYHDVLELGKNIVSSAIGKLTEKQKVMFRKRITVFFSSESIKKLKADAILCFNDENLSCSVGLAKTVADLAGEQYQKQCKETAHKKKIRTSDIVCIRTANLGIIINAIVPSGKRQYTKVEYKDRVFSALENAFKEIRTNCVSRLVMSPTGVDQRQIPYLWMGEAICKGITELTKADEHLREIYFVDTNDDYLRFLSYEMAKQVSYISVIDNVAKRKDAAKLVSVQSSPKPKPQALRDKEVRFPKTADKEEKGKKTQYQESDLINKADVPCKISRSPVDKTEMPSPETCVVKAESEDSPVPETTSTSRYREPCGFVINNSIQVLIHKCDLRKLQVDAIVNFSDASFNHRMGITKAIIDAGGSRLEKECRKLIRRLGPIPVSQTAITSAGNLPCKSIIHAVGPSWPVMNDDKEKEHCLEELHNMFINILQTAENQAFTSLAIPAVVSGISGIAPHDVASFICEILTDVFEVPKREMARIICEALASTNSVSIRQVHLVDLSADILPLIGKYFLQMTKYSQSDVTVLDRDMVLSIIQRSTTTNLREVLTDSKVKVFVSCGDITKQTADAIVCSNDEKLSCSTGLAKRIAKLAGNQYKLGCKQASKDRKLRPSDVVSIKSNALGLIINVVLPRATKLFKKVEADLYKQLLYDSFQNVIKEARRCGIVCLALSPLGADKKRIPQLWVADAMCRVIKEVIQSEELPKEIHIIDPNRVLVTLLIGKLKKQISSIVDYKATLQPQQNRMNDNKVICSMKKSTIKSLHSETLESPTPTISKDGSILSPLPLTLPTPKENLKQKKIDKENVEIKQSLKIEPVKIAQPTIVDKVCVSSSPPPQTLPTKKAILQQKTTKAEKDNMDIFPEKPSPQTSQPEMLETATTKSQRDESLVSSPPKIGTKQVELKYTDKGPPRKTIQTKEAAPPSSSSIPEEGAVSTSPQILQVPKYKVPCGFKISKELQVFIHKCDITRLETDAIVNLANKNLDHSAGVTKAIFDAGGEQLEKERRNYLNRSGPISVSQTAVTSGGLLPCKMVIHAVGPTWPFEDDEKKKTTCFKLLRKTFINILHTADKKTITSLAIPAVTSGIIGVPRRCVSASIYQMLSDIFSVPKDEVARIICDVLANIKCHHLKEVHIVDISDQLLSLIGGSFTEMCKPPDEFYDIVELGQNVISSTIQKRVKRKPREIKSRGRVKVFVSCDDITKLKADAIICSNDKRLSCSSGLAKDIADLAGKRYKKRCKEAAKGQKLHSSDVVSIKTKNLGIIIHVVLPRFFRMARGFKKSDPERYKKELCTSIKNAIDEARKHGVTFLAVSPLGAGQKRVRNAWIADAVGQVIKSIIKSEQQIKEIHIVDTDHVLVSLLRKKLNKYIYSPAEIQGSLLEQKTEVKKLALKPSHEKPPPKAGKMEKPDWSAPNSLQKAGTVSTSPQILQIPKYKVPCGFKISNGLQVFIHKCDITRLETDAIVNLANKNLDHPAGVTKAIFDAGGEQLEKERRNYLNRSGPISVSQTVVTSGGLLPCKMVIHAVGPTWPFEDDEKKKTTCFKLLRKTFIKILYTAKKNNVTSLAIPAVTSGIVGVPRHGVKSFTCEVLTSIFNVPNLEVARIICEVLAKAKCQQPKEIHIVDMSDQTLPLVAACFIQMSKQTESNKFYDIFELGNDVVSSTIQKRVKPKPSEKMSRGRVELYISCGDITQLKVDAIICSNDKKLSCSKGLAKYIADLAGKQYKKRCKEAAKGKKLHSSDVVSIRTKDFGIIINVVLPRLKKFSWKLKKPDPCVYKRTLHASYQHALDEARKHGVTCLAISPLGTGRKRVPNAWVVEGISQVLKDVIKSEQQIKKIHIVDTNAVLVRLLKKKLNKYISSLTEIQGNSQKQKTEPKAVEVKPSQSKSPPKAVQTETLVTPILPVGDDTIDVSPEAYSQQKVILQQSIDTKEEVEVMPLPKEASPKTVPLENMTPSTTASVDASFVATSGSETPQESKATLYPNITEIDKDEVAVPCSKIDLKLAKLEQVPSSIESTSVASLPWTLPTSKDNLKQIKSATMTSLPKKSIAKSTQPEVVTAPALPTGQKASIVSSPPETLRIPKYNVPCGFIISNSLQVFIHKCDITRLETDAIVNLANKNLDHPAGVTKAIFDAGGEQLEKERRNYLNRSGPISVSQTVVTSGGLLPCKMVIHAVGPTWPFEDDEKKKTTCFKLLRKTFINILHTADKKTITSLAIPAVATGVIGVPTNSVMTFIYEMLTIVFEVPNLELSRIICEVLASTNCRDLKEVHLVDISDQTLPLIGGCFKQMSKQKVSSKFQDIVELGNDVVSSTIQKRVKAKSGEKMSRARVEIHISCGDITQLKADAIICSNDKKLSCSKGLAKYIADLEGKQYKKRCKEAAKGKKLHPSDVVSVKTENLGLIINVVVPRIRKYSWKLKKPDPDICKQLLRASLQNAIDEAIKSGVKRLALSPLGVDQKRIANSWIADAMCKVLPGVVKTNQQLKEIHIIDTNNDLVIMLRRKLKKHITFVSDTGSIMQQNQTDIKHVYVKTSLSKAEKQTAKSERITTKPLPAAKEMSVESSLLEKLPISQHRVPCGFLISRKLQVVLHKSDIKMLLVDAIVHFTNTNFEHAVGIGKAIFEAAGAELERDVRDIIARSRPMSVSTTVITSAGRLPCKKVIHAVGPIWPFIQDKEKRRKCLTMMLQTYINIIKAAEESGCKTLAVPAIVSGIVGVPKHDAAAVINEMIVSVFKVPKHELARIICKALASVETNNLEVIYLVDTTEELLALIGGYFVQMSKKKLHHDLHEVTELEHDVVSSKIRACLKRRRKEFLIYNRVKIFVYCDDIMMANTDAVVCSNDGKLTCSTGLAKHIAELIGKSYKSRCSKAAKGRKLKPSDVVSITTERHGVIINVIVPQYKQWSREYKKSGGDNFTQLLRASFQNAIEEAKKCGVFSLALSPLGADQEDVPNYWIVDALCQTLKEVTESDRQFKEIHIVDKDKYLLTLFKNELMKHFKRPSNIQSAARKPVSIPKSSIPCGFLTMNIIEVFIHKCDITEIQVDAIVNHTDSNLDQTVGVAKAISDAAGPEMEKERRKILRSSGPISESETVVTSAGRLPCKIVIHAVGPKWMPSDNDAKRRQCLKLLQNTFINILNTADKHGVNTLAIPAVTSGIFGVTSSKVVKLVYEVLMNVLKVPRHKFVKVICEVITNASARNLKEIHLVDNTDQLLSLLAGSFLEQIKTKKPNELLDIVRLDESLVSNIIQKRLKTKQNKTKTEDKVKLFMHCCEITKVKADAVVCPNDQKLSCSTGPAKDIADSAGNDYKKRCREAAKRRILMPSDVVTIYTFTHGDIINVILPRLRLFSKKSQMTKDQLYKHLLRASFKNAINEAKKCGASSIAIYPLGVDEENISKTWISDAMYQTLSDCIETDHQLKEIHIVHTDETFLAVLWKKLHNANIDIKVEAKRTPLGVTHTSFPHKNSTIKKEISKPSMPELNDDALALEPKNGIPCGFLTLNIIQVYIHNCDITKLHVDALVNATDRKLDHASGLAKVISEAAGLELEHEGQKLISRSGPLRLCDTAVTSAGRLPCDLIIHAVFPAWSRGQADTKKEHSSRRLQETFINILSTANEYGINSLAMPALISGNTAMPAHDVAPIIRDTLASMFTVPEQEFAKIVCQVLLNTNSRTLKEIHIVDNRDSVLTLIADEFRQKCSGHPENGLLNVIRLGQNMVSSTIGRRIAGRLKELVIDNRVKVFVSTEDMTRLKVDAIVCPNDKMLSCSTGLAKDIAAMAGREYKTRCSEAARTKQLNPSDVVGINTDDLGIIINVVVPKLQKSFWTYTESDDYVYRELLQASFQNAIDEARKCDASSLAIYPLGADEDLVPAIWVVDKLCQALLCRLDKEQQIEEIHIIHESKDLIKFLWRELKKRIYHFNVVHFS